MTNENGNLPSVGKSTREVDLHDSGLRAGNLLDQSLARLNKDQAQALMAKAADEALRLQAKQTEQNIDYVSARKSAEDHVEMWDNLNKQGRSVRHVLKTDVKTGAGKMQIESKSGATCFVATAAYGDPNHRDVIFLRWFRDNILVSYWAGRQFITFYWRVGPVLAKWVVARNWARGFSKKLISLLVRSLQKRYS